MSSRAYDPLRNAHDEVAERQHAQATLAEHKRIPREMDRTLAEDGHAHPGQSRERETKDEEHPSQRDAGHQRRDPARQMDHQRAMNPEPSARFAWQVGEYERRQREEVAKEERSTQRAEFFRTSGDPNDQREYAREQHAAESRDRWEAERRDRMGGRPVADPAGARQSDHDRGESGPKQAGTHAAHELSDAGRERVAKALERDRAERDLERDPDRDLDRDRA